VPKKNMFIISKSRLAHNARIIFFPPIKRRLEGSRRLALIAHSLGSRYLFSPLSPPPPRSPSPHPSPPTLSFFFAPPPSAPPRPLDPSARAIAQIIGAAVVLVRPAGNRLTSERLGLICIYQLSFIEPT
jgi:hypothetical protein